MFRPGPGGIQNHGPQHLERDLADLSAGHGHGGKGWVGVLGEFDVVETDDGKVRRDAHFAIVGAVHDADGGEVVAGDDGGGRKGGEQLGAGEIAALDGEIRVHGLGFEPAHFFHAGEEGAFAPLGGMEVRRAADEPDAGVAQRADVFEGGIDAILVINGDVSDIAIHAAEVQIDRADLFACQDFHGQGIDLRREDGDARDLEGEQAVYAVSCPLRIVIGVHHDGFHVAEIRGFLEGGGDLWEEGISDVGNDDAKDVAAPDGEVAGGDVGRIAEFIDGGEHFALGFGPYLVALGFVEDKRNGSDGDARALRDVPDVGDSIARGRGRRR